jgi:CheY-like chemotaxis protein
LARYLPDAEVVSVRDAEQALQALSRSPSQALVVNSPLFHGALGTMKPLTDLPYDTPTLFCWVPGEEETAQELGVVRYLVKPVTRARLLDILDDLGEDVRTILFVDDQPEALRLFERMLSSAQREYDVLLAKSGRRALSMLRRRKPDVMLLDLIMPDVDGFRVLQEKSKDASIRDIPVVVISSRDPKGEPIVSDMLTVSRSGGLSVRDLVHCVQAVTEVLSPFRSTADRASQEKSGD